MSCVAYALDIEFALSQINETAQFADYDCTSGSRPKDWSEEDLHRIRAILARITALRVGNAEDAEDLVQDTLLTLTMKCPKENLEKGLLVWSMGVLRRKVGNYYRRTRREEETHRQEILMLTPENSVHHPVSPETRYFQGELQALILRILRELPDRQRQALELMLKGLPAHEIANRMAPETYQNVLNHLYRGRKHLARQLAKFGYSSKGMRLRHR